MFSHKADSKWGLNHTSKLLSLALLLVISLHILTWSNRRGDLLHVPCPIEFPIPDTPLPVSQPPHSESPPPEAPNSYFPTADSDIWHCRRHHVPDAATTPFTAWLRGTFSDQQALCAAHRQSQLPLSAAGPPRIAFLFLTRGPIPFEPLWRRFFASHESRFSIYVHVHDPNYTFPSHSLFNRHATLIPSRPIHKFDASLPEAARRLLAYALLDAAVPNAWFHLACDASIPIRSFDYIYDYVTRSNQSFVESFYPTSPWWRANWKANATLVIPDEFMRKGEFWVTLHRRHAGVVVGDQYVFPRFRHNWYQWGLLSEVYIATLMAVVDPEGVAKHSLVYVNWLNQTEGMSSPVTYGEGMVTEAVIEGMQRMTANALGFYQVDKRWEDETEKSCVYNGVAESPCFLFARKFAGEGSVAERLGGLGAVLGY